MNEVIRSEPGGEPVAYPFAKTGNGKPAEAETIEVAPGLFWVRMPLPFALNHINLWLVEDGDGWTIVDTGLWLDETKANWRKIFAEKKVGAEYGKPVKKVVVTHFHPDHMGLAGWMCEEFNAPLWTTRTEWLMCRMLGMDTEAANHSSVARFYASHGLDPEIAGQMFAKGNSYRERTMPAPTGYTRLTDGQEIEIGGRAWRVIVGTGHSPEHACLYCAELGVLISGDQILPKITPNISVWASEPAANPLQDYVDSLARFRGLPDDTLVLPSHNYPFTGLRTRLQELAHHHDRRLEDIMAAFGPGERKQAAEIIPVLFKRELDLHQMGFAMGEALAHLNKLVGDGRLVADTEADGRRFYARVA